MTDDAPRYSPQHKLPVRQPRAGELQYEFVRPDHTHVGVELRNHGSRGVEAQLFIPGQFLIGRRFETWAQAGEWAEGTAELEKGDV